MRAISRRLYALFRSGVTADMLGTSDVTRRSPPTAITVRQMPWVPYALVLDPVGTYLRRRDRRDAGKVFQICRPRRGGNAGRPAGELGSSGQIELGVPFLRGVTGLQDELVAPR